MESMVSWFNRWWREYLLSKNGYASLDITMDIRDEYALQIVKNVYEGSI